jgi:hypothetical protein
MCACVFVLVDSSFAPREFRTNYLLNLKSDVWLLVLEIIVFGAVRYSYTVQQLLHLCSLLLPLLLFVITTMMVYSQLRLASSKQVALSVHALSFLVWCTRHCYLGQKPRGD